MEGDLRLARLLEDYERGLLDEMNSRLLGEMSEKYGMAVNEVDKAEFRAAVQPVYDEYTGDSQGQVPAALLEKVAAYKVG